VTAPRHQSVEWRRRILEDPASLVFADLAEECRRLGLNDEAVAVARAGLEHHPSHLDARVTLGRALIDLDRLDAAFVELTHVLDQAPGNLPAIRALAEIYQRRGLMSEALVHYRRALELAQQDTPVDEAIARAQQAGAAAAPGGAPPRGEDLTELFDFDSLLARLGETPTTPLPDPVPVPISAPIQAIDVADDEDDLAVMERQLREFEEQRARDEQLAAQVVVERRRLLTLQELERWLAAILADRHRQAAGHGPARNGRA
jgi:tetratricopeptide (TPR) repeat protein